MLWNVPPMQGAEYLTEGVLSEIWTDLDAWVRREVAGRSDGLAGFLKDRAALWHQVGRVCFHLAENRRDPDYPFAFLATYAPGLTGAARVQYLPLSKALREYAGAKDKKTLIKLLSPVQLAAEKSELAKELVESGDLYQPLAWTPREAYRFLKDIPVLEESGVLVRMPDWWKKRPRPRVGVTIGDKKQKKFDANAMLDFRVQLALGDQELSEAEWRELMAAEQGLVFLKGQWVEVDHDKLAEALDHWKKVEQVAHDGLSFVEGMRLLAGAPLDLSGDAGDDRQQEWSFVNAGKWLGQVLEDLRNPERLEEVQPGADLKATLRKYQETGVGWLWFLSRLGLGACLADDMGLGKTIQVLALLVVLKKQPGAKPSLLVVPASLLANWKSEMQRFTPTLRGKFVHPSETPKDELARMAEQPQAALQDTDVVFTTYAMLQRQAWLLDVPWQLAVIDEAQAIKNPAAGQTKAVKRLKAQTRIALTGTPVENRLSDLWSLFDFLCPGLLGSQNKFKDFVKVLNAREQQRYAPLRRLVQPYILRRMKTDKRIIADLPDKTEVRAFCGLGKRQAAIYAKLVDEMARALESLDGMQRRGLVLAYLMRFKQLCNHPSQLLGDGQFASGRQRQVLPAGGDLRRDRVAAGKGPRLHPIPGNDRTAGGFLGGDLRPPRPGPARNHRRDAQEEACRPVPARRRPPVLCPVAEGRRNGIESDSGLARPALRPLVEPGGREPGDGPGVPDRPAPQRPGPQVRLPRHDRRANRRPDRRKNATGDGPPGRRGGEDADRDEQCGTDPAGCSRRGPGLCVTINVVGRNSFRRSGQVS